MKNTPQEIIEEIAQYHGPYAGFHDAPPSVEALTKEVERLAVAIADHATVRGEYALRIQNLTAALAKSNERVAEVEAAFHQADKDRSRLHGRVQELTSAQFVATESVAHTASVVPDGYVLVPIEPTAIQVCAGQLGITTTCAIAVYKAMPQSAPASKGEKE